MEYDNNNKRTYSPGAKTQGSPIIIWQIWSNLTSLYVQVLKYVNFAFYAYLNKVTHTCDHIVTHLKCVPFLITISFLFTVYWKQGISIKYKY